MLELKANTKQQIKKVQKELPVSPLRVGYVEAADFGVIVHGQEWITYDTMAKIVDYLRKSNKSDLGA